MKSVRRTVPLLVVPLISAMLASCATGGQAAATHAVSAPLVATGSAGPFTSATVTIRAGSVETGGFSATLDTGAGQSFPLPGPDEPADFFIVEPRSILFAPLPAGRGNGIVILYRSSRIGPGNGTDHRALVYRVEQGGPVREPALEKRLDGAATTAAARSALAGQP